MMRDSHVRMKMNRVEVQLTRTAIVTANWTRGGLDAVKMTVCIYFSDKIRAS